MRRVYVTGAGAVSAAGWGASALGQAVATNQPLPVNDQERPGWAHPLRIRLVPAPSPRPAFFAHPRLRRVSPLTQYAAGAVLEAVAALPEATRNGRLGLFCCLQSGTVQYAFRFFQETTANPLTASPMLFPETVFAAPASHIASLLGKPVLAHTFMGDPATFVQALALAATHIAQGTLDACVVVAAEESTWLHSDAMWHLDRTGVLSVGAGALCLSAEPGPGHAVELLAVTDAHTYSSAKTIREAARAVRAQLPPGNLGELLCDGLGGARLPHLAEAAAWQDWPGARLSPKRVLGEGLTAGAAWQCVLAARLLQAGAYRVANVSVVGCNQQSIGLRLGA